MKIRVKNNDLQNYCKRNYPECYNEIDLDKDYTCQKEVDEMYNNLIRNSLKLY